MQKVVITGVNRGLGKELFHLFQSKGYFVYGIVRNGLEVENLNHQLIPNTQIIHADLSNDESVPKIRQVIQETPIHLLINNAGIGGQTSLIENVETHELNQLFNVHCLGVLRTIKALKKNLLLTPTPTVINLNSRLGSITRQSNGHYKHLTVSYSYRIAKAAQNMLTNCLKNELKGDIQFISLHPGKLQTEMAQDDADLSPSEAAHRIVSSYERGELKETDGIVEIGEEIIPW